MKLPNTFTLIIVIIGAAYLLYNPELLGTSQSIYQEGGLIWDDFNDGAVDMTKTGPFYVPNFNFYLAGGTVSFPAGNLPSTGCYGNIPNIPPGFGVCVTDTYTIGTGDQGVDDRWESGRDLTGSSGYLAISPGPNGDDVGKTLIPGPVLPGGLKDDVTVRGKAAYGGLGSYASSVSISGCTQPIRLPAGGSDFILQIISSKENVNNKVVMLNGFEAPCQGYGADGRAIGSFTIPGIQMAFAGPGNSHLLIDEVSFKPAFCYPKLGETHVTQTFTAGDYVSVDNFKFGNIFSENKGRFCFDLPPEYRNADGGYTESTEWFERLATNNGRVLLPGEALRVRYFADNSFIPDTCDYLKQRYNVDIGKCEPIAFVDVLDNQYIDTDLGLVITQNVIDAQGKKICEGFWFVDGDDIVCRSIPDLDTECSTIISSTGKCELVLSIESLDGTLAFDQKTCDAGYTTRIQGLAGHRYKFCDKVLASNVVDKAASSPTASTSGTVNTNVGFAYSQNPVNRAVPVAADPTKQPQINQAVSGKMSAGWFNLKNVLIFIIALSAIIIIFRPQMTVLLRRYI